MFTKLSIQSVYICIDLLPQYTSCLFSMVLNKDIVNIEKPDAICLFALVVNEFSKLFLRPSIFSIIHSRCT